MDTQSETPPPGSGIAHVLLPRLHDLGDGFVVARMLPHAACRTVGPYVFLDQFGPVDLAPGKSFDVRPHPHIGLATVTYLYEGEIMHRDSIGSVQRISPGAVNWMTAGRGIVHSERTPDELRDTARRMAGLQFWVGLPTASEEMDPAFAHHAANELPLIDAAGTMIRLVVGALMGSRSPVVTQSETLLADVALRPGAQWTVPAEHRERAIQVTRGTIEIGGTGYGTQRLLVLEPGRAVAVRASESARVVLFGGDPLDGPRHLAWNFVSSSKERLDQAKEDWRNGRFTPVPGETEFIPLPP
jgi:redox-sensitive bicupin YhaK (pirin superfamily)